MGWSKDHSMDKDDSTTQVVHGKRGHEAIPQCVTFSGGVQGGYLRIRGSACLLPTEGDNPGKRNGRRTRRRVGHTMLQCLSSTQPSKG